MILEITLEREDYDAMHDVILDVSGKKPTDEEIQKHWEDLPDHIRADAITWGTDDTVFRDNSCEYLMGNKKS